MPAKKKQKKKSEKQEGDFTLGGIISHFVQASEKAKNKAEYFLVWWVDFENNPDENTLEKVTLLACSK